MKIGVCVSFTDINNIPNQFKKLREQGFDNCQIISWIAETWTDENVQKIKEYQAEYGVEISAFWCGWEGPCVWNFYEGQQTIGLVPLEYQEMRIKNLCDGADFAAKLGITNVVSHMGFIPEDPNDERFLPFCKAIKRIADHLKENNQWLLFETGQETPVTLLRSFETAGADNLGVNLDTANLILYGRANPVDALDVFGKYVRNLHAKDGKYPVNGHDLGEETAIGQGKVDFRGVIEGLHKVGYDGYITIEREIEGEQQAKDIIAAKEYLASIIKDVTGKDPE